MKSLINTFPKLSAGCLASKRFDMKRRFNVLVTKLVYLEIPVEVDVPEEPGSDQDEAAWDETTQNPKER